MKTLENLKQLAYRAHSGTSFSPEKRAESVVNDYSEELDQDLEFIKRKGASEEQIERYKQNYTSKISSYLSSKSNCISSMITGPSNFPVRRAEKANRSADNKYNEFREFRTKVLKAYERYERKQKIENAGGELEVAKKKLIQLEERQEFMKSVNKAYKAYKKNPQSLIESGLSESAQRTIIEFIPRYSFEQNPFPAYSLTNNNAMIKNTKLRIAELEKKEENSKSENKIIPFKGGVCELNYQLDRVTLKHDEKPSSDIIQAIKSNGFKWSPYNSVWMRKITPNAIYVTDKIVLPILNK